MNAIDVLSAHLGNNETRTVAKHIKAFLFPHIYDFVKRPPCSRDVLYDASQAIVCLKELIRHILP